MKPAILFFLVVVIHFSILASAAYASEEPKSDRKRWTAVDTLAEVSLSVLVYIDWRQTVEFTQHSEEYPGCFETNPLMGRHPDHEQINLVMGGSLLAHAFIATQLPQPYRRWWQFIWIGVEAEVVHSNHKALGVTTRF
jgi:hypothetical protein